MKSAKLKAPIQKQPNSIRFSYKGNKTSDPFNKWLNLITIPSGWQVRVGQILLPLSHEYHIW